MRHPVGKVIPPHVHNPVAREAHYTQEVLFLKKGRLRADFYDSDQRYLESRILEAGDVMLLATSGHGFEVLEEIEMIEVKPKLSGLLAAVEAGETVAIMRRGCRVAQRVPDAPRMAADVFRPLWAERAMIP